jgi:hypothetical protein
LVWFQTAPGKARCASVFSPLCIWSPPCIGVTGLLRRQVFERAFVIPVAIVSPAATAATQAGPPQGAAAPGGVFAALFAVLGDAPDPTNAAPAATPGDGGAELLALLHGMVTGETTLAKPAGEKPSAPDKDGDTGGDDSASLPDAMPVLATAMPIPAAPPEPGTSQGGAAAPVPPPSTANPQTPLAGSPPPTDAAQMPPPPGAIAAALSSPTAPNGEPFPPLGALPLTADANAQPALPAQIAPQAKPGRADTLGKNDSATQPASDEADIDPDAPLPGTQAKKSATAGPDTKPLAAGDAKPAAAQPATTSGNTAPMIVATASPDAALPLPVADGAALVKTVPVSQLANLPPGAAVTAIGAVIASEAGAGTNRFVIRLDPPELGRIDVRLRFGKDGEVHARMIADRPETASMLMRDAAALERALNASGLRTADAGIDVMLRDSSGGFARTDGGFGGDAPPSSPYAAPTSALESMSEAPVWIRPASSGRLDLTV